MTAWLSQNKMADSQTQVESTEMSSENLSSSTDNKASTPKNTHSNNIPMMYEDVQKYISSVFEASSTGSDSKEHNLEEEEDSRQPKHSNEIQNIFSEVVKLINHDRPSRIYSFSPDKYSHSCVAAQALAAYLTQLDQQRISKLAACMKSDCTHWLAKLFNFENGVASYHDYQWQGLTQVCRLALLAKYPKYATEGFTALYTRPPVVYISTAATPTLGQYLCSQLGLPQSSICKVPCNTVFGSNHTLDIAAFERLFNDDVACGKTPLLLVAYAGTPLVGHTDNLARLRELCTQNGLWLHLEGDNLAALSLPTVPPSIKTATACDSMSLHISKWFGLTGCLSFCTFFRAKDPVLAACAGLTKPSMPEKLSILPLWTSIQNIGVDEMRNLVLNSAQLAQQLCLGVDSISSLTRIAQSHCTSLVVVFRYRASLAISKLDESQEDSGGDDEQDDSDINSASQDSITEHEVTQSVQDSMNTKLADYLAKVAPNVVLDVISIPKQGQFLKFDPISTSRVSGTSSDHIEEFVLNLKKQVISMDTLLAAKSAIKTALEGKENLIIVDCNDSSGAVAAILCFPPYWNQKTKENLSEAKKMELTSLNKEIFDKVAEYHGDNFSLGSTVDGLSCINMHQVSHPQKYTDLVELLSTTCTELADSSKFLEQMQEIIMKGIVAAEEDLHKDAEERMLDDGIRNVPLVGSFYNWFSPPPKETDKKGRTFNLSSGHLQTTETTYKYHMQVQGEDSSPAPSTPNSTTTPVKENANS